MSKKLIGACMTRVIAAWKGNCVNRKIIVIKWWDFDLRGEGALRQSKSNKRNMNPYRRMQLSVEDKLNQ